MKYYIAIDGGGTKTESVLIDENGHILQYTVRRGCNPMDYGTEDTYSHVCAVVEELIEKTPGPVAGLYAGIAGLNRIQVDLKTCLSKRFSLGKIRAEADGFSMISGALGHVDGCGMVCGTGSSLFIRREGKPHRDVGGLGYLIDTGGSGFELARDGLKAAYRYLDGRGAYTVLADSMAEALGKDLYSAFQDIYRGGRSFIASLAHVVFEGASTGDEICMELLDKGARSLADLTIAAARYFESDFTVVMNGGILKAYPNYVEAIQRKASPQAHMIYGDTPPVYGGCVEALWDCGILASDKLRGCFMEDYARLAKVPCLHRKTEGETEVSKCKN